MGDRQLKTAINAALAARPGLSRAKVDVYDGRVILIGDVDTLAQEREALEAVRGVPEVREVLSALWVAEMGTKEAQQVDDATLKSRIEATLRDHGIIIQGEGAVVSQGDVFLRGRVDSPRQRIQAERLATTVKGMRGVHNELGVRG